jgi:tRNA (guanine37-N1)-methyltransferase
MKIRSFSLFPQILDAATSYGVAGQGVKKGLIQIEHIYIRDYATDKHKTCDDTPCGGGPGMVMKLEPIYNAFKAHGLIPNTQNKKIILCSPAGRVFNQSVARELAELDEINILCGRYEGIDARISNYINDEISIGDYILSGGELAGAVIIDSVVRLLPEIIGNPTSHMEESFEEGLLDYPDYTKPEVFDGYRVPEVLMSGDHAKIAKWRKEQAIELTRKRRPDLLKDK